MLVYDIDMAVDHARVVAEQQSEGFFLLSIHAVGGAPLRRAFINNRHSDFAGEVRRVLKAFDGKKVFPFYGLNAYRAEGEATVGNLAPCTMAQVDADGVAMPPPGPPPSRMVETSPGNHQLIFFLDRAVTPDEAQAVSRHLTQLTRGDAGGHAPNKLLRLPGTLNLKPGYGPDFPEVRVVRETGELYSPEDLLAGLPHLGEVKRRLRPRLSSEARHRMDQPNVYGGLRLIKGGKEIARVPGEDRSKVIWAYGDALVKAGATRAETSALVRDLPHWREREKDGKAENIDRLLAKLFPDGDAFLGFVDPSTFAGQPVPEREWLLEGLVPMKKVTALYGDGGTGKTTLAFQLMVAVAAGGEFLGRDVRHGRVLALMAENDIEDTQIALAGCSLEPGRMQIDSRAGEDSVLMRFGKDGGKTTALFERLLAKAMSYEPALIVLDTAADVFDGNENDRGQVRRFISEVCARLAIETGAAVLLLAHPSRDGLRTGSGDGGSTAWHNAVRSRLYLERHKEDRAIRVLSVKKAQYGPDDWKVELRWQGGVYVLDSHEERIVREVRRAWAAGKPWGCAPNAKRVPYIVDWITEELELKAETARIIIDKLLKERRIIVADYGGSERLKGLCAPDQKGRKPGESDVKAAGGSEAKAPIAR